MLRYLAFRKLGKVALETLLLLVCVLAALFLRFEHIPRDFLSPGQFFFRAIPVALVFQFFLHLRDVYDFKSSRSIGRSCFRLIQALVLASGTMWILYLIFPDVSIGKRVLTLSLLLSSVFLLLWHMLLRLYFRRRKPREKILVLGTGRLARELTREILRRPELGIGVSGFVDDDLSLVGVSIVNPKVIGLYGDLLQVVSENQVDRIVVELQDRRGRLPIDDLLTLKSRGFAVEEASSLYEWVTGKIALENLKPSWMIFNSGFERPRFLRHFKRVADAALSLLMLIAFLPVMLVVAVLIKLDSKGPVLHRQTRVGEEGRTFTLWKFRSMYENAERETGPVWAEKEDPRVTPIGRILRRLRLDELPQLYNILRGDMSLVGPRPERPEFVEELVETIPYYQLRHSVKPGVTGWAQVYYQYASSVESTVEKLQYDLFYIKHMSPLLDILIVLETIKTVLVRKGS